jgi:hypothetical protein
VLSGVLILISSQNALRAQQEVLFGVTSTDLVRINPDNPGPVTIVGPHNIATVFPNATNAVPHFALTYHPTNAGLFGIARRELGSNDFEYGLVRFDMFSGQASLVSIIGTHLGGYPIEGFEYVDSQQSLVISRGVAANIASSEELLKLALDGTTVPIVTTPGHDNDSIVYDSARDLFYGFDPNDPSGAKQFVLIDLMDGNTTSLGAIPPNLSDVAYSATRDAIFGHDFLINRLYRIDTSDGLAPIMVTNVDTIADSQLRGIAFAVIPEPTSIVLTAWAFAFVILGCMPRNKHVRIGRV